MLSRARRKMIAMTALLIVMACSPSWSAAPVRVAEFNTEAEVGKVDRAGTSEFDPASGRYRVTGSGANIWAKEDAFHFVYSKVSGGLRLSAEIHFDGPGKNGHRKACLMVRQGLEPDAPYADVAVHGDGLISLQFRKRTGDITAEVQSKVKSPAFVQFERRGNVFTLSIAPHAGEALQAVGSAMIELKDPVYVGLAVSSHDATVSETAVFSNVELRRSSPAQ